MNMDLWDAFLILAQHLHFGRAAEALCLSQPALTQRIQRLETQVGATLFERGQGGTRLTPLGQQLLPQARQCQQTFQKLLHQGQRLARGEAGRLRLGFGFHTLNLVPEILLRLRSQAPGIEFELRDMSTQEQLQDLARGQLDLGFLRLPVSGPWATLPVVQDQVVLVSNRAESLKQCAQRPFVLISQSRSPTLYAHCLRLCAAYGFQPQVVQQVSEITTALALIRAGMGVSLLPGSFVSQHAHGVKVKTLPAKIARWRVGAAWSRQHHNPALGQFLQLLRQHLELTDGSKSPSSPQS